MGLAGASCVAGNDPVEIVENVERPAHGANITTGAAPARSSHGRKRADDRRAPLPHHRRHASEAALSDPAALFGQARRDHCRGDRRAEREGYQRFFAGRSRQAPRHHARKPRLLFQGQGCARRDLRDPGGLAAPGAAGRSRKGAVAGREAHLVRAGDLRAATAHPSGPGTPARQLQRTAHDLAALPRTRVCRLPEPVQPRRSPVCVAGIVVDRRKRPHGPRATRARTSDVGARLARGLQRRRLFPRGTAAGRHSHPWCCRAGRFLVAAPRSMPAPCRAGADGDHARRPILSRRPSSSTSAVIPAPPSTGSPPGST